MILQGAEMTKENNEYMAVFFIVLCGIILCTGCAKKVDVQDKDNQVIVNAGQFHAVMEKGTECSGSYLVVGGCANPGMYFDWMFSLIPMAKAEDMSGKYGDFFQCQNPGSDEAKQSAKNVIFIAADAQVRSKISRLGKIVSSGLFAGKVRRPVIRINAVELKMIKLAAITGSKEDPVEGDIGSTPHFLVKDVEIVKEDYDRSGGQPGAQKTATPQVDPLEISGIMMSSVPCALVGGKTVKTGDKVGDYEVLEIQKFSVKFRDAEGKIVTKEIK